MYDTSFIIGVNSDINYLMYQFGIKNVDAFILLKYQYVH